MLSCRNGLQRPPQFLDTKWANGHQEALERTLRFHALSHLFECFFTNPIAGANPEDDLSTPKQCRPPLKELINKFIPDLDGRSTQQYPPRTYSYINGHLETLDVSEPFGYRPLNGCYH